MVMMKAAVVRETGVMTEAVMTVAMESATVMSMAAAVYSPAPPTLKAAAAAAPAGVGERKRAPAE
jgi:hypothetical protein